MTNCYHPIHIRRTIISATANPTTDLHEARERRDNELAAARADYSDAVSAANDRFAAAVRKAAEETSMSDVSRQLKLSRQSLHRLVRGR